MRAIPVTEDKRINDEATSDRYIVFERSVAGQPDTYVVFDRQNGARTPFTSREAAHSMATTLNR